MKCRKGFDIEVMQSGAGYYIGTIDYSEGYPQPNCRITEYYNTRKTAEEVLKILIKNESPRELIMRDCVENEFCNGGEGCFKGELKHEI